MVIRFKCVQCGKLLETVEQDAGLETQCPECGAEMTVPPAVQEEFLEFACASCAAKFRVRAAMAGKRTHCPKCKTPLEVPGVRPTTEAWAAPGQTSASVKEDKQTAYEPGKTTMNPIKVALLIASGLLAAVVLTVVIVKVSQPKPAFTRDLACSAVYTPAADTLTVSNGGSETWTNVTVTIYAGSLPYMHNVGKLNGPAKVDVGMRDFHGPAGKPLDPFVVQPQSIEVRATFADGATGSRTIAWKMPVPAPPAESGTETGTAAKP